MTINQLFKKKPSIELIEDIVKAIGLNDIYDTTFFSKHNIDQNNSIEKINKIIPNLEEYYLPCKRKIYLNNLNYKRVITILRQCLKVHNFLIKSKEKYIKGDKIIIYQILPLDEEPKDKKQTKNDCIISFD